MKKFDDYMNELRECVEPLRKYYNIDRINQDSVYVWDKENTDNIFDIFSNEIIFWSVNEIVDDAIPIVKQIQNKLKEYDDLLLHQLSNYKFRCEKATALLGEIICDANGNIEESICTIQGNNINKIINIYKILKGDIK